MNKKDLVKYADSPLSRLNALGRFGNVFEEFDKLWKSFDVDVNAFSTLQPKNTFPKINVAETDEAYEVDIALAGFDKDCISLEIKENTLLIKADKKEEVSETDSDKKYLMKEISSRSFRRVLNFPKKVIPEEIECKHENGVISCTFKKDVPKVEDNTYKIEIK